MSRQENAARWPFCAWLGFVGTWLVCVVVVGVLACGSGEIVFCGLLNVCWFKFVFNGLRCLIC